MDALEAFLLTELLLLVLLCVNDPPAASFAVVVEDVFVLDDVEESMSCFKDGCCCAESDGLFGFVECSVILFHVCRLSDADADADAMVQ
jgi:hypothetical protein